MALVLSRMPSGEPEIFASIQGEGASAGVPSTFVRLATCNLRCSWCDTAYTWDWERYDRAAQTMTAEPGEILTRVQAFAPRNVVVTGGEPLLQRHVLVPLAEALKVGGYRIEVETNGTIAPGALDSQVDQWNVSPKLAHAGNEGLITLRPEVLRDFGARANAFFKLVVRSEADLAEVAEIVRLAAVPSERVLLMPEGRTRAELEARSTWLAEACARLGYRFSPRLHILLWGDKRGV